MAFEPTHKYEAITLIDTLEHLTRPRQALGKLREMLTARGVLAIELPDAAQAGFSRMGSEWRHLKPAEHAYYFGREHMVRLLAECGFRVVDEIVPYPDRRVYYARKA
jgi:hypothetical protein